MNICKIIYLNCGERYEFVFDHNINTHKLSSCEIWSLKKIEAWTGTGIAEVMRSNPVQAWVFTGLNFATA